MRDLGIRFVWIGGFRAQGLQFAIEFGAVVLEMEFEDPGLELDRGTVDGIALPATQIRSEEEPAEALADKPSAERECGLEEERAYGGSCSEGTSERNSRQ